MAGGFRDERFVVILAASLEAVKAQENKSETSRKSEEATRTGSRRNLHSAVNTRQLRGDEAGPDRALTAAQKARRGVVDNQRRVWRACRVWSLS